MTLRNHRFYGVLHEDQRERGTKCILVEVVMDMLLQIYTLYANTLNIRVAHAKGKKINEVQANALMGERALLIELIRWISQMSMRPYLHIVHVMEAYLSRSLMHSPKSTLLTPSLWLDFRYQPCWQLIAQNANLIRNLL